MSALHSEPAGDLPSFLTLPPESSVQMTNSSRLSIWCHLLSAPAGGLTSNVFWVVWRGESETDTETQRERQRERETEGERELGVGVGQQKKA